MVVTDDLVELVKRNSGEDYSAYFDFYLRTTELINVQVDSIGPETFDVSLANIDFELPMEVVSDKGSERIKLSSKPYRITTTVKPEVDPNNWFLKRGFRK